MRILHLAYRDTSGVPGRWAAAHRAAGHEAHLLVELPHPYDYRAPCTQMRWSPDGPEAINNLLGWADAIMAYDHPVYLETALATGKPVMFRALGQSSREYADEIRDLLSSGDVIRASAGTGDLALLLDIPLTGAPYPLPEPARPEGLRLCHAPSDRGAKGTDAVLRAAAKTGWEVDLIEDASNAYVMERKRHCALVVDSIGPDSIPDGHGVNGVEGMALGLPVITTASPAVRELWERLSAPVAFAADESDLVVVLESLRDPGLRAQLGAWGREFVATFHSPQARAAEDTAALSLIPA